MSTIYPLIWIAFITSVFLVWFFSHRANHKERLMMIEKGIDIDQLERKKSGLRFPWLKLGILIIGLSIGLLIIAILASLKLLDRGGNALPLAILGICGGVAIVISNKFSNDKRND